MRKCVNCAARVIDLTRPTCIHNHGIQRYSSRNYTLPPRGRVNRDRSFIRSTFNAAIPFAYVNTVILLTPAGPKLQSARW